MKGSQKSTLARYLRKKGRANQGPCTHVDEMVSSCLASSHIHIFLNDQDCVYFVLGWCGYFLCLESFWGWLVPHRHSHALMPGLFPVWLLCGFSAFPVSSTLIPRQIRGCWRSCCCRRMTGRPEMTWDFIVNCYFDLFFFRPAFLRMVVQLGEIRMHLSHFCLVPSILLRFLFMLNCCYLVSGIFCPILTCGGV